ncbi:MAG: flagellar hook-basal body complex protein FliE [Rhodospirillaceae bacterium]|nr:flagellar hook-basal body complex protein FliE [Rhodospirillaceae bacterium]
MVVKIGEFEAALPTKGVGASGPTVTEDGKDFASFVKDAGKSAVGSMYEGENMSLKAIAGEADLTDVVQAVGKAELTLQTVSALRDRMITAYQAIARMPI